MKVPLSWLRELVDVTLPLDELVHRLNMSGTEVEDVIEVGNADRMDYFATLVVSRRDDVTLAETVAAYLGGPPILRQTSGADAADVTVVIGRDRSRLRLGD